MSINRLIELFISASKSWQLTRTSYLNSEAVTSLQIYEREKKDPF